MNKEGEFPKIFPFTKFNIDSILGCLDRDVNEKLIILEGKHGETVDQDNWRVNAKGYLIDKVGNIIDRKGNWIFDKDILDEEGEIPKVYWKGVLWKDSTEDLKGIWAMIENDKKKAELNEIDEDIDESEDEWLIEEELRRMKKKRSETSGDSKMGDNPRWYNKQNWRRKHKGKWRDLDSDLEQINEKS